MRQPFHPSALRVSLAILAATCGWTGCGGEGSNPGDVITVIQDETGMLRRVRSAPELEGLLADGLHEPSANVMSVLAYTDEVTGLSECDLLVLRQESAGDELPHGDLLLGLGTANRQVWGGLSADSALELPQSLGDVHGTRSGRHDTHGR